MLAADFDVPDGHAGGMLIAALLAVRLSAVARPERPSSAAAVSSACFRGQARHCWCAHSSEQNRVARLEVASLRVLGRFPPRRLGLLVPSSRRDLGLAGRHNWGQTHSDQRVNLGPNTRIAFDSSVSLE